MSTGQRNVRGFERSLLPFAEGQPVTRQVRSRTLTIVGLPLRECRFDQLGLRILLPKPMLPQMGR
jgi:hypothetical protein